MKRSEGREMSELRPIDDGLWVAEQPLRFLGIQMGCRMTAIRLESGGLLLHSPIGHTAALQSAVAGHGVVEWLMAPNKFHHLFVSDWRAALPDAKLALSPGLAHKREDLVPDLVLGQDPTPWGDEIEVAAARGIPALEEWVLFHRPTSTLVITDLAFHLDDGCAASARFLGRVGGTYGRLAPTRLERLMVRDAVALRQSVERILEWPFERVVMAHGSILEEGGRAALESGFDWLLHPA